MRTGFAFDLTQCIKTGWLLLFPPSLWLSIWRTESVGTYGHFGLLLGLRKFRNELYPLRFVRTFVRLPNPPGCSWLPEARDLPPHTGGHDARGCYLHVRTERPSSDPLLRERLNRRHFVINVIESSAVESHHEIERHAGPKTLHQCPRRIVHNDTDHLV